MDSWSRLNGTIKYLQEIIQKMLQLFHISQDKENKKLRLTNETKVVAQLKTRLSLRDFSLNFQGAMLRLPRDRGLK
jgi:hypothetical protein